MPLGPGVIWLIAMISVNSLALIQLYLVTTSPCIMDNMA